MTLKSINLDNVTVKNAGGETLIDPVYLAYGNVW